MVLELGTKRQVSPRRLTLAMVLGATLLVGGLAWSGWVAWQLFGTNWVSHRAQARTIERLEESWKRGERRVEVEAGVNADALIRIPRFGADYAVPVLRGTGDQVLAQGFGHVVGTAEVGKVGNYVVAAHRVTHGEPLRRMPDLRPGDKVIVETSSKVYTYVLDTPGAGLVVDFTAGWVLNTLPANPKSGGIEPAQRKGQKLITLLTCSELFHTDNRLVAFGHLTSATRR